MCALDNLSFSCACLASPTRSLFSPPRLAIIPSAYFNLETNERFSFVLISKTWLSLSIYCESLFKSCSWASADWVLLFNCSFYWAYVVTLFLKPSISLTKLVMWLWDILSFYCPSLTWPLRPWFYSPILWSLFLKSFNSLTNLVDSRADCLNFSCPSLICPARPWFYLWALSYLPPVSWSLLFNSSFSLLN